MSIKAIVLGMKKPQNLSDLTNELNETELQVVAGGRMKEELLGNDGDIPNDDTAPGAGGSSIWWFNQFPSNWDL